MNIPKDSEVVNTAKVNGVVWRKRKCKDLTNLDTIEMSVDMLNKIKKGGEVWIEYRSGRAIDITHLGAQGEKVIEIHMGRT